MYREIVALAEGQDEVVYSTNGAVKQGEIRVQTRHLMRITAASTTQAVLPGVGNGSAILVRWRFAIEDLQRQQPWGDLIARECP